MVQAQTMLNVQQTIWICQVLAGEFMASPACMHCKEHLSFLQLIRIKGPWAKISITEAAGIKEICIFVVELRRPQYKPLQLLFTVLNLNKVLQQLQTYSVASRGPVNIPSLAYGEEWPLWLLLLNSACNEDSRHNFSAVMKLWEKHFNGCQASWNTRGLWRVLRDNPVP